MSSEVETSLDTGNSDSSASLGMTVRTRKTKQLTHISSDGRAQMVDVTVALLTIYDMCKAVDKQMQIHNVRLVEKTKRAVAVSLCETDRLPIKASHRVAHTATDTTRDSQMKRKS